MDPAPLKKRKNRNSKLNSLGEIPHLAQVQTRQLFRCRGGFCHNLFLHVRWHTIVTV